MFRTQCPKCSVQGPESSVQSPASNTCVQGPGIPACPFKHSFNDRFNKIKELDHKILNLLKPEEKNIYLKGYKYINIKVHKYISIYIKKNYLK